MFSSQSASTRGRKSVQQFWRTVSTWGAGGGGAAMAPAIGLSQGSGTDRAYRSRRRADKEYLSRKSIPPRLNEKDAESSSSLLRVERFFGCRVVSISSLAPLANKLDVTLVRALRDTLERLEKNPSVTIVVLQGLNEACFSNGTDVNAILSADRTEALQLLTEQSKLNYLVATFDKPIVSVMHGTTEGSALALAKSAAYVYSSENSTISLPDVSNGIVPHAGATFHLSRMRDGVGLYMALTGARIQSVDTYWAGVSSLFGTIKDLRSLLPREAGFVSGDENTALDLQSDKTHARALETLRKFRADSKMGWVASNLGEDVSRELFDEYIRLKRWYAYWAAGDKSSAEIARSEDRMVNEDAGDLFDFHESKDLFGGRGLGAGYGEDHPGSYARMPRRAAAERRARIGALSAHAASIFSGGLSESDILNESIGSTKRNIEKEKTNVVNLNAGPSASLTEKLRLIRRCFGSARTNSRGTVVDVGNSKISSKLAPTMQQKPTTSSASPSTSSSPSQSSTLSTANPVHLPLVRNWEQKMLKNSIEKHIREAREHCEMDRDDLNASPSSLSTAYLDSAAVAERESQLNLRMVLMSDAVRESVQLSWPSGKLTDDKIKSLIEKFYGPPATPEGSSEAELDAAQTSHRELAFLLRIATARTVADLLKLSNPYALVDNALVTSARRLRRRVSIYTATGGPSSSSSAASNVSESSEIPSVSAARPLSAPLATGKTAAISMALAPQIQGPMGFTIPTVENAISVGEVGSHSQGGVVPVNPRIMSDPDGLFYDYREDEDTWWPFSTGQWKGDLAGAGATDALPISPILSGGDLRLTPAPVPANDGTSAVVGALRVEALRVLTLGDGSASAVSSVTVSSSAPASLSSLLGTYTKEVSRVSLICAKAAAGDMSSAAEVEEFRQSVLGKAGSRAVSSRFEHLRKTEYDGAGGVEGSSSTIDDTAAEFDVTVPGDQLKRASAFVAWPHLSSTLKKMRAIVFSGLARHAFGETGGPSETDIQYLASLAPDTPWGYAELVAAASFAVKPAAEGAPAVVPGSSDVSPSEAEAAAQSPTANAAAESPAAAKQALRLLNTWLSIVRGTGLNASLSTSSLSQPPSSSSSSSGARGVGFLQSPRSQQQQTSRPVVKLDAAQLDELRKLAVTFAHWEGVALGDGAGGRWIQSEAGKPRLPPSINSPEGATYALGAIHDDESGLLRVTLYRTDVAPSTQIISSPSSISSSSTTSTSSSSQYASSRNSVPGLGNNRNIEPALNMDDVRRRVLPLVLSSNAQLPQQPLTNQQAAQKVSRELQSTGSADLSLFRNLGTGKSSSPSLPQTPVAPQGGMSSQSSSQTATGASAAEHSTTKAARWRSYPPPDYPALSSDADHALEARSQSGSQSGASSSAWDYDSVLRALTDSSGASVANLFGLPQTGNVLAAGSLVASTFAEEADSRIPLPFPDSIAEIRANLNAEIEANSKSPSLSDFAKETLALLDAAPKDALEIAHSLILAAGTLPIDQCMILEHRAMTRLLLNSTSYSSSSSSATQSSNSSSSHTVSLLPLEDPKNELNLGSRPSLVKARNKKIAKEQGNWERAYEAYLAGGEGTGIFGDLFRRRYVYFKNPLGGLPFGDHVEEVLAKDTEEAAKEGVKGPVDVAEDILRSVGGQFRSSSWGRGGGASSGNSRADSDESAEIDSLAVHVAIERSLQREYQRADTASKTARVGIQKTQNSELEESKRFSALKGIPNFLK